MTSPSIVTASFIGAGSVARNLAPALQRSGIRILEVCNRSGKPGRGLATKVEASYVPKPSEMDPGADLFIIAVTDNAIAETASRLKTGNLVVHTSGAMDLSVLDGSSPRTGVFYPLQTFGKKRISSWLNVPVCIEASLIQDQLLLLKLGMLISTHVIPLDSEHRRILHLSAVFASNFSNFMYSAAEEILAEHDISFDLLRPIINQTARNARHKGIFTRQTGPAVREDQKAIAMHKALLKAHPDLQEVYDRISKSIILKKRRNG